MITATIAKNGTIDLPATIRKKLGVNIGDKVSFIATDDEIILVPVHKLADLINIQNYEKAVQIIEELHKEHRKERL